MRLFLSAETLRRVRIVLLRATHLPYVMLIWTYESSRRSIQRPSTHLPPLTTARGHGPSTVQSIASRCQDPHHHTVVEVYRADPGLGRTPVEQQVHRQEPRSVPDGQKQLADVIDAVDRLQVQVNRLTKALAAQPRVE